MFDLILKNGLVVTPDCPQPLSVAVKDGKIAGLFACGQEAAAKETYDLAGKILFPGVIDSHAHVTYCGDFFSGSRTAASGGVTTLVEMPQSGHLPSVFDREILEERIRSLEDTSIVDCALYGGVKSHRTQCAEELIQKGIAALKVFMSDAGEYGSFDDGSLLELFRAVKPYHTLVAVHAESQDLCAAATQELMEAGKGAESNSQSRPVISEVLAVTRLCILALHEQARISVCHISSSEVLDVIRQFRQKNLEVYTETCPHYLLLTSDDVTRCKAWAKCAPPIRDQKQADALWDRVIQGEIDMIGSDHATYSDEQKSWGDFWSAPGGFPGLDLILPGLYSEGVLQRGLSLTRLAQITASGPAKVFGLDSKGSIQIGKDADFAVLDPDITWTFHAADTCYDARSSRYPYEGKTFRGKVAGTFVRGRQVYDGKKILLNQKGRYVTPG